MNKLENDIFGLTVITSKKKWQKAIEAIDSYDFYHTYDYHNLSKKKDEKQILLRYQENQSVIYLPLLIRKIKNTNYYDATSVYGYSGPIGKNIADNFDNKNFIQALGDFFENYGIVSVFTRLNPFIPQQENLLENIGSINVMGNIVNIDLKLNQDEQKTKFSKTTKRYLNKVRNSCVTKISKEKDDINKFIELYYENMNRVNANQSYYFKKDYFYKLSESKNFDCEIIFAILKETQEIISAAMMVKTNGDIIQYHISGTLNKYLHLTPIRLLIDETRIRGTEQGYKYFNLGGGLGGQEGSLFNFKASFSKDFKKFKVWNYITNKTIYEELTTNNPTFMKLSEEEKSSLTFFPLYRYS